MLTGFLVIAQIVGTAPSLEAGSLGQEDSESSALQSVAGGVLGSLAGLGVGLLVAGPQRCGQDDVGCIVRRLGYTGSFTVTGAAGGAWYVDRRSGRRGSFLGALGGAVLGGALGGGAWKLLEEAGHGGDGWTAALVFTLPQGLLAAAGSRLLAGH